PVLCTLPAPPPPDTHPLSLHDALPIFGHLWELADHLLNVPGIDPVGTALDHLGRAALDVDVAFLVHVGEIARAQPTVSQHFFGADRKSTRLNSSHVKISYAVFCLKKKR